MNKEIYDVTKKEDINKLLTREISYLRDTLDDAMVLYSNKRGMEYFKASLEQLMELVNFIIKENS